MRKSLLAVSALLLSAAPAFAQEGAAVPTEISAPASASAPQATASVTASRGQTLVAANGARIGRVLRVNDDGSPSVIYEGKVVTVPLATLTVADGRLVSSLSAGEIADLD